MALLQGGSPNRILAGVAQTEDLIESRRDIRTAWVSDAPSATLKLLRSPGKVISSRRQCTLRPVGHASICFSALDCRHDNFVCPSCMTIRTTVGIKDGPLFSDIRWETYTGILYHSKALLMTSLTQLTVLILSYPCKNNEFLINVCKSHVSDRVFLLSVSLAGILLPKQSLHYFFP